MQEIWLKISRIYNVEDLNLFYFLTCQKVVHKCYFIFSENEFILLNMVVFEVE